MGAKWKTEKKRCLCPYCNEEIAEALFPYCQVCKVNIFYCPKCREPVPRDKKACPHCGAEIKAKKT